MREQAGDLVEKVEKIDTYVDKKNDRFSMCFRIHYRSLEKTLTN